KKIIKRKGVQIEIKKSEVFITNADVGFSIYAGL
ncbi:unnamed protein product, partial [marine sediment metagenome]